jgi:hypothetical protein
MTPFKDDATLAAAIFAGSRVLSAGPSDFRSFILVSVSARDDALGNVL